MCSKRLWDPWFGCVISAFSVIIIYFIKFVTYLSTVKKINIRVLKTKNFKKIPTTDVLSLVDLEITVNIKLFNRKKK